MMTMEGMDDRYKGGGWGGHSTPQFANKMICPPLLSINYYRHNDVFRKVHKEAKNRKSQKAKKPRSQKPKEPKTQAATETRQKSSK